MTLRRFLWMTITIAFWTSACRPPTAAPTLAPASPTSTQAATPTSGAPPAIEATGTALPLVPNFKRIGIIIFENREYGNVIGSAAMPYFNILANTYVLLTQYYAVSHPSLPNYLSLIAGDTMGITDDCDFSDCFLPGQSLPDLIEQSGRTWKTYQDDMPEPCYTGDTFRYVRKHNPFMFFDNIRLDTERCARSVVPLTQLDGDIAANALPNYFFITPDLCYSAHDCNQSFADGFLREQMEKLIPALDATGEPYLMIVTWDEGQGDHSCCGLPTSAGGRVATILISPQAKSNFQDSTPYSHYSLLKTISAAWSLDYLRHAGDADNMLITAPWK